MLGLKLQIAIATAGAIILSVILFGASYFLTPNIDTLPMPKPLILHQIVMGLFWIGLSALLASSIVGCGLLINRVRKKKTPENLTTPEQTDDSLNDSP